MTNNREENPYRVDPLLPDNMAKLAENAGVAKTKRNFFKTFTLAVLAGAFIAFGAVFATTVTAHQTLSPSFTKLLGGVAFSLGLILVIIGGAELFTGNNLMVMAWANKRVKARHVLKNWAIVYLGNFVGAFSIVLLMFFAMQYAAGNGSIGLKALNIAETKSSYGFSQAVFLGILCNVLVCLAVWLCYSAKTTGGKIVAILFPITAFVAAGFEHSVANMYFIPKALLIKSFAPASFWSTIGSNPDLFENLTWNNFLFGNLLPVTIGNIIGGAVLVGLIYWSIYLRGKETK